MLSYPYLIQTFAEGGYLLTFPDFPEMTVVGEDGDDIPAEAELALADALAARRRVGAPVPPAAEHSGERVVLLSICTVAAPAISRKDGESQPPPTVFLVEKLLPGVLPFWGLQMHLLPPPETQADYWHETVRCIIDSPLMMFDLTGADPSICYELGLRYMSGKPLIAFVAKGLESDVPTSLRHIAPIVYAEDEPRAAEAEVHYRLDRIRNLRSTAGCPLFEVLPDIEVMIGQHEPDGTSKNILHSGKAPVQNVTSRQTA
jgi:predicted RNase H-like HicB family nuclease